MSGELADELRSHRARYPDAAPTSLVFTTRTGGAQTRHNIRRRILLPTVAAANRLLAEQGKPPIAGLTNHSLRRTFASLAYAGGASPAEVMSAMGHSDPSLALAIYASVVTRRGGIGARIDAALADESLRQHDHA